MFLLWYTVSLFCQATLPFSSSYCLVRQFFTYFYLSIHRLVQFVDSYDPPIKGLHEDLNFVSPRIGEVIHHSFISIVITSKSSSMDCLQYEAWVGNFPLFFSAVVVKKVTEKVNNFFLTSMYGMCYEGQLFYLSQVNCFCVQYFLFKGKLYTVLFDWPISWTMRLCYLSFLFSIVFCVICILHYSYIACDLNF
jgi:hypothetical protein